MLSTSTKRIAALSTAVVAFAAMSGSALAQKKYDTGASDTEIKIGNIMPYSGPASAYGVIGKTEEAYFKMINDKGGINGSRSISSPTMTATARRKPSSRFASWSRATRCCWSSIRSARRRTRRSRSI